MEFGDDWFAVTLTSVFASSVQINHRCGTFDKYGKTSPIVHPMQKNTHKRHGVRYRCRNCKAPVPQKILIWLKLNKLYDKVNA